MNKVIAILIVVLSSHFETFAEMKLSIINDKDGFTNFRSGKGSQFEIVGQIKDNEFFYCEKSNDDWYSVVSFQRYESGEHYGEQLKGYIHKSRIQIIEELPILEQSKIIKAILEPFKKYNNLFKDFYATHHHTVKFTLDPIDTAKYNETVSSEYVDNKFNPILKFIENYYCKTNDLEILNLLLSTAWSNSCSAREEQSSTIAECYVCNEKQFINQLKQIEDKKEIDFLIGQALWGLCYHFDIDPTSENITNKEYLRLEKQINELKK